MNASWLLVAEIALPLLLFISVLGISIVKRRKAVDDGCHKLLKDVKANDAAQKTSLERFLKETLLIADDDARSSLEQIMTKRRVFIKSVMDSHLELSSDSIKKLDAELNVLLEAYHSLVPGAALSGSSPIGATASSSESGEISSLREENERLKKEMNITLGTLNNIFAEYSSMFGEEQEHRDMGVNDILSTMENLMGSVDGELSGAEVGTSDSIPVPSSLPPSVAIDETAVGELEENASSSAAPADEDLSWENAFAEAAQQSDTEPKT